MTDRGAIGGFILAGGKSSRMGQPKGLLPFSGKPMVKHLAQLLEVTGQPPIIIGPPHDYAGLGLRVVPDDRRDSGPLGGISTALRDSDCGWNLIVGCDLPFLTPDWLAHLIARAVASPADAVVPLNERGFEPLCAMYRKRIHSALAEALDRGVRKITDALAGLAIETIAPADWKAFDPRGRLFKNINTPADYDEARLSGEEESGQ
jgi:molybdopterin-guanine dinucleotide biosynthesis protein A